jgi:hypothetical protein
MQVCTPDIIEYNTNIRIVHQLKVLHPRNKNITMNRLINIWNPKPLSAAAAARPAIGSKATASP